MSATRDGKDLERAENTGVNREGVDVHLRKHGVEVHE
jgi:hypothetical protein